MAYADLPLEALRAHRSAGAEPADFDARWAATLAASRGLERDLHMVAVETGVAVLDTWDIRFPGFEGEPIAAWFRCAADTTEPLPCIVEFVGYGGGRGLPHERLLWGAAGYAHLLMDTRGQGAGWSVGATVDPAGSGPAAPGVMTRGVEDFDTYYYRRLITDAVRAVDAARSLELVDPDKIVVAGGSQGGGLAIAAAALAESVAGAMVDVPFLCDFPRALQMVDSAPYSEIASYLRVHRQAVDSTLQTLAFVDGVHHAARTRVPALFSVALMDPICPPSTVYAAYNAWAGEKTIIEYQFNGHEGGGSQQEQAQLHWLAALFKQS